MPSSSLKLGGIKYYVYKNANWSCYLCTDGHINPHLLLCKPVISLFYQTRVLNIQDHVTIRMRARSPS